VSRKKILGLGEGKILIAKGGKGGEKDKTIRQEPFRGVKKQKEEHQARFKKGSRQAPLRTEGVKKFGTRKKSPV